MSFHNPRNVNNIHSHAVIAQDGHVITCGGLAHCEEWRSRAMQAGVSFFDAWIISRPADGWEAFPAIYLHLGNWFLKQYGTPDYSEMTTFRKKKM
jgi:hypothetical protein